MVCVPKIALILFLISAPVSPAFAKAYCVKNPIALSVGGFVHVAGMAGIIMGSFLKWVSVRCFFPGFPIPENTKTVCNAFGVDPTSDKSKDTGASSNYGLGANIVIFVGLAMTAFGGYFFYPACGGYATDAVDAFRNLRETIAEDDFELQGHQYTHVNLDPASGSSSIDLLDTDSL